MLALKAAAAVAAQDRDEEAAAQAEVAPPPASEPLTIGSTTDARRPTGRPKGRRPVAARQTVYLDDARHAALVRLAEDRGRSVHSLIIEGIDHVIGKPVRSGWQ